MSEANDQAQTGTDKGSRPGGFLIFLGASTVFLGILAIAAPLAAGIAVAVSVGVLLVGSGVVRIVQAIRTKKWGPAILGSIAGILAIVAGAFAVSRPVGMAVSLTLLLAFYLFAHGVTQIIAAFQMRPQAGWGWNLVNAIITVMLGVMIWRQWPISGAWALGILLGIHLLSSGGSMIAIGVVGGRLARTAGTQPA